jgi:hypothetical protein
MIILIITTIYVLSVLLTRWVMIRQMIKMKSYYPHRVWYIPLLNIIFIFDVLSDDNDFYKWWTGDND